MIRDIAGWYSRRSRRKRAAQFLRLFSPGPRTRILDLGSADGAHVHAVLEQAPVDPANVHVADIGPGVERARRYGYQPHRLDESGALPFADDEFDIVWCSSVIEHVTVPKRDVWRLRSSSEFALRAFARQRAFAREIRRIARGYWVQTPARSFPLESHSWLPFVGWLPRPAQIDVLKAVAPVWPKRTAPDWHLLRKAEVATLFPDAEIRAERSAGLVKSWVAVRRPDGSAAGP